MVKRFLVFLLMGLVMQMGLASVIQTQAKTYPITETPINDWIKEEVGKLLQTGEWQKKIRAMSERFEDTLHALPAVSFISVTTTEKNFYYNPSIIIPNAIQSPTGENLIPAGTLFNPLSEIHWDETLVFYDASDPKQQCWAKQIAGENFSAKKFILVGGDWSKESDVLNRPVYFDQAGRITRQLGITHTPALVTQDGNVLKISEVLACP